MPVVFRHRHLQNRIAQLEAELAIGEAVPTKPAPLYRAGFVPGIPNGGANAKNPAQNLEGTTARRDYLHALFRLYARCSWAAAAVDAIAKTVTAGALEIVPDLEPHEMAPIAAGAKRDSQPKASAAVKAARELFEWCNPEEDIVQLLRRMLTDLLIYGDAYMEVTWVAGRPAALWSLDCPSMEIDANEHGVVTGYRQVIDTERVAEFRPWEVIHFKLDDPRGGLYGLGPTQKAELVITEWLFASALVQEVFRQGDPPKVHIDWPLQLQDTEIEVYGDKYRSRNKGAKNVGNPIETKGGGAVKQLQQNRIADYLSTLDQKRDEIVAAYHVPPAEVGIIESGNLGGGTGSSQFKMFLTIACQPPAAIVLEKLTSKILREGFGIVGWKAQFGEFDWRDDNVVDMIADRRIRNGRNTLNESRGQIGLGPVQGGHIPIIVDRQNMLTWPDIEAMSKATVANTQAQADIAKAMRAGAGAGGDDEADDDPINAPPPAKEQAPRPPFLRESWQRRFEARRRRVMRELDDAQR